MIMSDNKTTSGGIGFTGALFLVFLVLKLCNIINWSWWWITCPLWGGIALFILGGLIYVPIELYFENRRDRKIINERGELKSKWQERLDEMKEAQKRAEQLKDRNNA